MGLMKIYGVDVTLRDEKGVEMDELKIHGASSIPGCRSRTYGATTRIREIHATPGSKFGIRIKLDKNFDLKDSAGVKIFIACGHEVATANSHNVQSWWIPASHVYGDHDFDFFTTWQHGLSLQEHVQEQIPLTIPEPANNAERKAAIRDWDSDLVANKGSIAVFIYRGWLVHASEEAMTNQSLHRTDPPFSSSMVRSDIPTIIRPQWCQHPGKPNYAFSFEFRIGIKVNVPSPPTRGLPHKPKPSKTCGRASTPTTAADVASEFHDGPAGNTRRSAQKRIQQGNSLLYTVNSGSRETTKHSQMFAATVSASNSDRSAATAELSVSKEPVKRCISPHQISSVQTGLGSPSTGGLIKGGFLNDQEIKFNAVVDLTQDSPSGPSPSDLSDDPDFIKLQLKHVALEMKLYAARKKRKLDTDMDD